MDGLFANIMPKSRTPFEAVIDAINRGTVAGMLGGPVDTVTTLLRPLGYNVEAPVGGSEWIGQMMQRAGLVGEERSPTLEMAAGMLRPSPKVDALAKLPMLQGALTAGMLGVSLPKAAPVSNWTAYHGSPHQFDRFSMDRIGTGEGAQSYGHGLYYADVPNVANVYKNGISNPNPNLWQDVENVLPGTLKGKAPDFADAILQGKTFDDLVASIKPRWQRAVLQQEKARLQPIIEQNQSKGYLYKVDINDARAPKEAFLDWDKPLSQQSESVRKAINGIIEAEELYKGRYSPRFNDSRTTGGEFVGILEDLFTRAGVADTLRGAGIPGIRYLDEGSRGLGRGTHNTVLFDDSLVKIISRE